MTDDTSRPMRDRLGWERYSSVAGATHEGAEIGRVRRVDRGESDVITDAGEVRVLSDSTRSQSTVAPATGDWVAIAPNADADLVVTEVLPRVSAIVRRDPAEEVIEQVLVANVDVVGVVVGVDRPCNVAKLERFLVLAADSGAEPVVVLTKADLGVTEEWQGVESMIPDVRVVTTSAVTGSGLDDLRALLLDDRTLVLLGESGSGKSSLVNALVGDDVQETAEVRQRDAKGRHTTTARELILIPGGGVLIDTPGIRGVGLWDAEPALMRVFSDITDLGSACRFGDCSHRVEPGCAVQEAVERGELDALRLERFLRLRAELDEQAAQREQRGWR